MTAADSVTMCASHDAHRYTRERLRDIAKEWDRMCVRERRAKNCENVGKIDWLKNR